MSAVFEAIVAECQTNNSLVEKEMELVHILVDIAIYMNGDPWGNVVVGVVGIALLADCSVVVDVELNFVVTPIIVVAAAVVTQRIESVLVMMRAVG